MLDKLRDGFDNTDEGRELIRQLADMEKRAEAFGPEVKALFDSQQCRMEEYITELLRYMYP